jgi:hypothetical protein
MTVMITKAAAAAALAHGFDVSRLFPRMEIDLGRSGDLTSQRGYRGTGKAAWQGRRTYPMPRWNGSEPVRADYPSRQAHRYAVRKWREANQ